jgi:hypothetical protein
MLGSPRARWSMIALGAGLALGLMLYPTDEKRVREAAEALVAGANQDDAELQRALERYAAPEVSLSVTALPEPLQGRAALVEAASQARALGQKLRFRLELSEVMVEGNRARLTADLVASLRLGFSERRQVRRASAWFEKRAGQFQLVSAEVGSERHDQPEARP